MAAVGGRIHIAISGLSCAAVLLPLQIRQARMSKSFIGWQCITAAYWKMSRLWVLWGVVATVPLVAATCLLVFKP